LTTADEPIEYNEENERRVDSTSVSRGGFTAGSGNLKKPRAGGIFVGSIVGVLSASVGSDRIGRRTVSDCTEGDSGGDVSLRPLRSSCPAGGSETLLLSTVSLEVSGSADLPFLLVEVDEADDSRIGLVLADGALLLLVVGAGGGSMSIFSVESR
jgi:hypothetical protein